MNKLSLWRTLCLVSILCAASSITLAAGTFITLANFNGADGKYAYAALVQATDGSFYGTTFAGGDYTSCGSDQG